MKVLFATGIYPPDIGGPATYVEQLTKELPRLGVETSVVTYSDEIVSAGREHDQSNNGNTTVRRVKRSTSLFGRYARYFFEVWKMIPLHDVVYVQGPVSEGLPAMIACLLRRKKYVLKIVGDYAWEQGRQRFGVQDSIGNFQKRQYGWKVELMRKIQKIVVLCAEQIVVPSNYLKSIVEQWGIQQDRIEVIYNTVEISEVLETKEVLRNRLGLSGKVVLSVGRLVPWKGFSYLIDAIDQVRKKHQDIRCYIIGDGPEQELLEEEIHARGLGGCLRLLPKISHSELLRWMKAADVFVLYSMYEGLSHVLVEATLLNVPIVASDIAGNREVVNSGENGVLVQPEHSNELARVISQLFSGQVSLSHDTKKEQFSHTRMIKHLLKVLESV